MTKLINFFKGFKNDESGAVTVDWVVLTAAVVGLGALAYPYVEAGVNAKGDAIQTDMGG